MAPTDAFDHYKDGDVLQITYEAGSDPGSTRLVVFRELVTLRIKGAGFTAMDHTELTKNFCIEDVSAHELKAQFDGADYNDWYHKIVPEDSDSDDEQPVTQDGTVSSDNSDQTEEADLVFPDISAINAAYATEVETLQAEYDCNKRAAMMAFEHEWEGKNQPRLERNTKRARRTQIANIRSAVDQFEKSL